MDPRQHPDLARLGRQLRERLDDTLEAEQHAARAVALRRRTMRDRLLEAEDRTESVVVSAGDGQLYRGIIVAVGADHIVLADGEQERFVSLDHLVTAEFRS
jgi:hypothetical protein